MNSNFWQGKRSGALALTMLAAVVAVAGVVVPAQAQTFPVTFPAPTSFTSSSNPTYSTVAVAIGDFNGDGSVTAADLLGVTAATKQAYNLFADINGDGVVNTADTTIVKAREGATQH